MSVDVGSELPPDIPMQLLSCDSTILVRTLLANRYTYLHEFTTVHMVAMCGSRYINELQTNVVLEAHANEIIDLTNYSVV